LVPGLKQLADTAHEHGAKIFFQLAHAGRQTDPHTIGQQAHGAVEQTDRSEILFLASPNDTK
jgi:2,4-dienoyl-CoA reductase-like NADH-dependent reductase (Old Yellow Enzyme family)